MLAFGPDSLRATDPLESKAVRETLGPQVIAQRLAMTWPQHSRQVARRDHLEVTAKVKSLWSGSAASRREHENQRWLQAHAVALSEALLDAGMVVSSVGTSVPGPFLVVLVLWLTMIFVSFGVLGLAQRDRHCRACVCTLSVVGASLSILEMDSPFEGPDEDIIADPLRYAYARINLIGTVCSGTARAQQSDAEKYLDELVPSEHTGQLADRAVGERS